MAFPSDIWTAIQNALIPILPTIAGVDWTKSVVKDLFAVASIQNIARAGCCISIFDWTKSKNTSRYALLYQFNEIDQPIGISSAVSSQYLYAQKTQTITLSLAAGNMTGAPFLQDAVSANFGTTQQGFGSVAIVTQAGTLDDLATLLAAAINANTTINANVTATSSGPVVTITNNAQYQGYRLSTAVGNVGSIMMEVAKRTVPIQVTVWSQNYQIRDLVGNAILNQMGQFQVFGITYPDGTYSRCLINHDHIGRDEHLKDLYRWDFILDVEIGITPTLDLYGVLFPDYSIQVGLP